MSVKNLLAPYHNQYLMGNDKTLGRQTQYFAKESIDFIKSLGKYADNHYRIEIQPWGDSEPHIAECRIEDSFDEQANLKRGDDWKDILFYDSVPNITVGLMAWFEGSAWLGFNTRNIASLTSSVTVRRCDSVLNFKDEFNNITSVPFVFDKYTILNSTTIEKSSQPVSLVNGYKNAWAQYNQYTATLKTNDRFVINGVAWQVRGIDDVSRQYTDNRDSVRVIAFVLMRTEEREGDDLERDIADADANVWSVVPATHYIELPVGDSGVITADIIHNGSPANEYPLLYSSTDEAVVTVDEQGNITAIGEGEAVIQCAFGMNEKIFDQVVIRVTEEAVANYELRFDPVETKIPQYEDRLITARLYLNGTEISSAITFDTDGVPNAYYKKVSVGNMITVYCNAPYTKGKLKVTARAEVDGQIYEKDIYLTLVSVF